MRSLTASGVRTTSMPSRVASPEVGSSSPQSMRITVDLPEPFGPRKPKIAPRGIWKETESTAVNFPNLRVRLRTAMAGAAGVLIDPGGPPGRRPRTSRHAGPPRSRPW